MRVEDCCQSLLEEILPILDPQREGVCIDVGVGTFAFYCERFARLGFNTVAVEPLPVKKLQNLCQRYNIPLIQTCLSNRDGVQDLYMGKFLGLFNHNFNSLSPDWFGASSDTKQVKSMMLSSLLSIIDSQQITCIKLDVECGYSLSVIIDYAYSSKETIFDLRSSNLDVNELIPKNSIYGNIISFKDWTDPEEKIAKLCSRYYGGIAHRLGTAMFSRTLK